jgi:hypothetical protein
MNFKRMFFIWHPRADPPSLEAAPAGAHFMKA